MAITSADYQIWKELRRTKQIPQSPAILEIGQANWYGDYPLDRFLADVEASGKPGDAERLRELEKTRPRDWLFELAEIFYRTFLDYSTITAIDKHGTSRAKDYDLNGSFLEGPADIVINTGTIEHIWNAPEVFRQMHQACKAGGLMFHCLPFRGWLDHGFWQVNPTLIMDLGAANQYKRLVCCYSELDTDRLIWLREPMKEIHHMEREGTLGKNALLYVVWQKTTSDGDVPFKFPMQGQYAGTLTAQERQDWRAMR